jgi:dethiobiotin synthetase
MTRTFFITGTDTGAGKTVLTALLAGYLRGRGFRLAALKPVSSGSREDARRLRAATGGMLPLDEINPWHFRAAIAPLLAARRKQQPVRLEPVLAHLRRMTRDFDVTLIEGAGGLLSPLGAGFNSRDLIAALDARPVIAACNRLGVVNHVLLTLEALPGRLRRRARVVLLGPPRPDLSTATNAGLLEELLAQKVFRLPWFGRNWTLNDALRRPEVAGTLKGILGF